MTLDYKPNSSDAGYSPPVGGIPKTDLDASTQAILNKAAAAGRPTRPSDHGFAAWTFDPTLIANSTTATTGKVVACRLWLPKQKTISKVAIITRAGGTGATPLANGFVGLFSKTGQLLGQSANVGNTTSGNWGDGVNGLKEHTLSVISGQSLAVGGASEDDYAYVAYLLGTNSTTALTIGANAQQNGLVSNVGLTNATATAFSAGVIPQCWLFGTGLTALPTSVDLSSTATTPITPGVNFWFGVKE